MRLRTAALLAFGFLPSIAGAQSVADHIAAGDREYAARKPAAALPHYEAALADRGGYCGAVRALRSGPATYRR